MLQSVEPAISISNKMNFLIDWEITLKCNLDCGYCSTGIDGGHDNSIPHSNLDDCLKTIDFMFEYVDLYINQKKTYFDVILNVYGGESLHHPHIEKILKECKDKHKNYNWNLITTNTTNLIITQKKLSKIINYIDEFTTSFHSEANLKQIDIFKNNLLFLKNNNKRTKVVVLMNPYKWNICIDIIDFCEKNNIKYLAKQLDQSLENPKYVYTSEQILWFKNLYNERNFKTETVLDMNKNNLSSQGRGCCGGRKVCINQNFKARQFLIKNNFTDWYCSVNHFFVYIKQVTGDIFTNKDCKMSFDSKVGPIGNLKNYKELLSFTKENLEKKTLPTIICKKNLCLCGLCSPKAQNEKTYNLIMSKYIK